MMLTPQLKQLCRIAQKAGVEIMKLTHISLWLGAWLLGPALSVQAALPGDAGLFDAVTVYGGQGVDHNLGSLEI